MTIKKSREQMLFELYCNKVQKALMHFQFMEIQIKMYLGLAYAIIRKKVKNDFEFKYTLKDFENDSLGMLIKKFQKINTNKSLIGKINSIKPERDMLAHEAYVLTYEEQKDESFLTQEISRIEKIAERAKDCQEELGEELKKIVRR